ncbi:hypothetical protein [Prosthecobacter sp.]|uniref:hypothetical protein n=1 Tax=Prosthecobacter sp. TaxID=1965333 RepID=UPI0037846BD0
MEPHPNSKSKPPPRIPRNPREARQRAEASCAAWNHAYPVGTRVRVYTRMLGDEQSAIDTTTTSQAWVAGGHSAMVCVRGLSGGYALTHVRPLAGQTGSVSGERAGVFSLEQNVAAEIAEQLGRGVLV